MKKIVVCSLLMPVAFLDAAHGVPGAGHVALVATTVAIAASSNFVHALQPMPCVTDSDLCEDDLNNLFKERKDRQLSWQRNQESFVKRCVERNRVDIPVHETFTFCPHEGESIESFVERATSVVLQVLPGERETLPTEMLLKEEFWDLSWKNQRFLLAMNIDAGLWGANDPLPVSHLTPLDHAAKQKDHEMIFFLWEHGAREAKDPDTLGFVKKDVMMRSSDERSIEILREIVSREDGKSTDWLTFEWATDLDPELVQGKVNALVKPVFNALGNSRPKYCIPASMARRLPEHTPGAKALRDCAMKYSDWLNCQPLCAIQ